MNSQYIPQKNIQERQSLPFCRAPSQIKALRLEFEKKVAATEKSQKGTKQTKTENLVRIWLIIVYSV